jgi:hypothetical protein
LTFTPCLVRAREGDVLRGIALGHPMLDDYLTFVGARARTNTWLAIASDLKVFFNVVGKEPTEVTTADVFAFLAAQRTPRNGDMVRPGWPPARSPGDCRACEDCSATWSLAVMLGCRPIRSRGACTLAVPVPGTARAVSR